MLLWHPYPESFSALLFGRLVRVGVGEDIGHVIFKSSERELALSVRSRVASENLNYAVAIFRSVELSR